MYRHSALSVALPALMLCAYERYVEPKGAIGLPPDG